MTFTVAMILVLNNACLFLTKDRDNTSDGGSGGVYISILYR